MPYGSPFSRLKLLCVSQRLVFQGRTEGTILSLTDNRDTWHLAPPTQVTADRWSESQADPVRKTETDWPLFGSDKRLTCFRSTEVVLQPIVFLNVTLPRQPDNLSTCSAVTWLSLNLCLHSSHRWSDDYLTLSTIDVKWETLEMMWSSSTCSSYWRRADIARLRLSCVSPIYVFM